MSNISISVVIATFNSEKKLPDVLSSIRKQSFSQSKIEILVVDGYSTDRTQEIAKKFNAKVIFNPKIEPVNAKLLGFSHAKGKYIVYIDADEVIENKESFAMKYALLENNGRIKAVIGSGYKNPSPFSFIQAYINEFGDPFSFFIYRISKKSSHFIKEMKKQFSVIMEDKKSVIFDFTHKQIPIIELGAANTMIDLQYIKKRFPKFDGETFAHLFYILRNEHMVFPITKDDPVIHHSSTNSMGYLKKITWRIKNNLYHKSTMGKAGFTGREKYGSSLIKYKKYLFLLYACTFIFVFYDAILLSLTRRHISYLWHIPLTLYTAGAIVYYYVLKLIGKREVVTSYGGSVKSMV